MTQGQTSNNSLSQDSSLGPFKRKVLPLIKSHVWKKVEIDSHHDRAADKSEELDKNRRGMFST